MKYFFIYKTINKINGKYYIGAHTTTNIKDSYLGSGKRLKQALEKYGRTNFEREILYFCFDVETLYEMEEIFIKEHLGNEMCYNLNIGGKGGWHFVNSTDVNKGKNNIMNRSPEIKKQVIENGKQTKQKNKEYYDNISRKNGVNSAKTLTGVKRSPEIVEICRKHSLKNWAENYDKMVDCLSSTFKVISPDGTEYITNRLRNFCIDHNLTYVSVWNTSVTNKPVKKGKSKGWKCIKILTN